MYIVRRPIEVLSYDEELETIFAKAVTGSVVLDIIPAALDQLRANPKYKQIYLQDNMGVEFVIPQGASLESAIDEWKKASSQKRGTSPKLPSDDNVRSELGA